MKIRTAIGRILSRACIWFTVLSLVLYTGGMLASGVEREWIPTLKMMYLVLLFSVLFSAVNDCVRYSRLPGVVKVLVHYAVSAAIFYVVFILWGGYSARGSSVLVLLLAFTIVYIIGALIAALVRYLSPKSRAGGYEQQFHNKD